MGTKSKTVIVTVLILSVIYTAITLQIRHTQETQSQEELEEQLDALADNTLRYACDLLGRDFDYGTKQECGTYHIQNPLSAEVKWGKSDYDTFSRTVRDKHLEMMRHVKPDVENTGNITMAMVHYLQAHYDNYVRSYVGE